MDFYKWLDIIDTHYAALSTCALTQQDEEFDKVAQRIDNMIAQYPQYWQGMKEKRNMPGF